MAAIEINVMTDRTVEAVELLERQCFSSPWSLASLMAELSNPLAVFRTAEIGGEVAGYVGMHHVIDEGYITNIAVAPAFRRRGVAKALLADLLAYAEKNGMRMLTLEVRESNVAAQSLYSSFGFEKTGVRRNFYSDPAEDGVLMTRFIGE